MARPGGYDPCHERDPAGRRCLDVHSYLRPAGFAVLLRRVPLMALVVTLAGLAATSLARTEIPASALQVVVACAAGLEICYMAATRNRAVSVAGLTVAGAT